MLVLRFPEAVKGNVAVVGMQVLDDGAYFDVVMN